MLKAFERRRFTGGRGAAPMEVDAAIVLAAEVSRSIDDGELVLERLAIAHHAMKRRAASAGRSPIRRGPSSRDPH
jgi:hypothetical protein